MKTLHTPCRVSGIAHIQVVRKGKVVHSEVVKNLLMNGLMGSGLNLFNGGITSSISMGLCSDSSANYLDVGGTWQVSAGSNIMTRVSGSGTFTSGSTPPGCVGCEIKFADGTRAHIVTYTNSTTVVLSKTFTAGVSAQAVRQYWTNYSYSNLQAFAVQSKSDPTGSTSTDLSAGTKSRQMTFAFNSATSSYTLNSVVVTNISSGVAYSRITLASGVPVEVDDQVNITYTLYATVGSRDITFDMSNVTNLPFTYSVSTITGNGTYFDIVTTAAHHFLTGDSIVLPAGVTVPKRFAISSGSSTSSAITVNTTLAHGLSVGNTVVIENASVGGYNGTWTVDTVPDTDTFTISSALNPGALGASGTVRLATPGTYFNGTWTVASIPNSTTVRVTSAITGPAVDTVATVATASGAKFNVWNDGFLSGGFGTTYYYNETNKKSVPAVTSTSNLSATGQVVASTTQNSVTAAYTNDWVTSREAVWNAGTSESRVSQIYDQGGGWNRLLTFDWPQPKPTTHKLVIKFANQLLRDLP